MRSPNETTDDYSKLFYQADIFDEDEEFLREKKNISLYNKIKRFLSMCLLCKRVQKRYSEEAMGEETQASIPRKLYSFTELELRNITPIIKDAGVQTGSSLETSLVSKNEKREKQLTQTTEAKPTRNNSELNLLQMIRNLKISDSDSDNKNKIDEEKELCNTVYEKTIRGKESDTILTNKKQRREKHLRFDEEIITIPRDENDDSMTDADCRRHLNTIREVDESPSTSGKDFMRFWRTGKNKKQKKSHFPLR